MPCYSVKEEIELLTDAGLLTGRQAEAFVHRRVENTPGFAVADEMGVTQSTVSDYVTDAEAKIEAAEATLEVLETIRWQATDTPDDEMTET